MEGEDRYTYVVKPPNEYECPPRVLLNWRVRSYRGCAHDEVTRRYVFVAAASSLDMYMYVVLTGQCGQRTKYLYIPIV